MNSRQLFAALAALAGSPTMAALPGDADTWIEYWDDHGEVPWLRCYRARSRELGVPNLARAELVPRSFTWCEELHPTRSPRDLR